MKKIGRNTPCSCGSGKKYKHCCAPAQEATGPVAALPPLNIPEALARALVEQRAGRSLEAKRICQDILAAAPDQPDAMHLLGVHLSMEGRHDLAFELIRKAIDAKPGDPFFYNNFALTLQSLDRLDEAAASCRKAIELAPNFAVAHSTLAGVLKRQGRLDEAIASCRRSLDANPENPNAHNVLGSIFQQQHKFDEAIACYRKALSLKPDHVSANLNLGTAFTSIGHFAEAVACYQKVMALQPDMAANYYNWGQLLMQFGKGAEAAEKYQRAVDLNPTLAWAHNNMASVLKTAGRLDEALEAYKKALALEPDNPAFHSNLLFFAQYFPDLSPPELFSEHLRFAQRFEWPLIPTWRPHANSRDPERRMKIGYVSADLHNHAVAYFIEPVLACHDKAQVEIFCYYNHNVRDAVTERLVALADHWLPCQELSDDQLAERIRADGIDILVDLSGHTGRNRLSVFARKPAPVQATWIGYPGTTGLVAMDYRITDAYMDPPGLTECHHTEQLIRLPGTGAAYQPPPDCPAVNELPALTEGVVTFASLNSLAKVNPAVIALWARLLAALPQARLKIGNAGEPGVRQHLLDAFGKVGIAPERLWLQPRLPMRDYLAMHHRIDVALDPFPYNGGTTTNHSLWMGVPVITMAGENVVSRCGVSLLSRVGLTDYIVHSEEEYLQRALQVVQDLPGLNRIRQSLRSRMDETSGNAPAIFTRQLEGAYRDMWRKWCASGA